MNAPQAHMYYGPKPFKTRPSVVDRDTVMTIRRLREWAGWRPKEIALVLGVASAYVHNVCNWTTRVDVDPGPRPHPDSEQGAEWARELFRYFGLLDAAKE